MMNLSCRHLPRKPHSHHFPEFSCVRRSLPKLKRGCAPDPSNGVESKKITIVPKKVAKANLFTKKVQGEMKGETPVCVARTPSVEGDLGSVFSEVGQRKGARHMAAHRKSPEGTLK